MADPTLTAHTLAHDDYDRYFDVFSDALMADRREQLRERFRPVFRPERSHGVFDGTELVGVGGLMAPEITLPGAVSCPLAAVTAVGVRPGHRRRGVLTTLMRAQLDALREAATEPIAALFASEGAIYGRFGYAVGSEEARLALPRGAAFRPTVEVDPRPVREVGRTEALELLRRVHPAVADQRIGWLTRDEGAWHARVLHEETGADGTGALRYAVHPEGYALYRPKSNWTARGPAYEIHVQEVAATTPRAYATLWRHLLDLDLVGEVRWNKAAVDEPVTNLLADPRLAVRDVSDALWVRLVDLDRALRARRYSAPLDVVIEVTDSFCPWNAGRRRLRIDEDGVADVAPSDASAQLAVDTTHLAAAYLGGTSLSALGRAGLVTELGTGALRRTSRAFAAEHAPHCPEGF
ncbi:putative acetyltransferase [Saccharopolyspora lacisalsi]|uniref:Putative acetyltransferase n=1 Tax=Halosaccharopolyspora lacisalsi TaxID=1000566 RepID=A0A839DWF2_9PSEU|nr:GNAT family N-acetyltransferase [Halosaccharopolyspora lacisalsi]MBA8825353.1 putative acetyltransferase [Halosaccharopolyspora lacisalsi]